MRPGLPDPLINLLGARWAMGAPVVGAAWFGANGSVAFGLADGTLAIARAGWDGAAKLQPREGGGVELLPATEPPPPVSRIGVHAGPCRDIAGGVGMVLSGGADGRLARIDADGEVETLASLPDMPIERVAIGGGAQACAAGRKVHRFGEALGVLDLAGPATALAFDPVGQRLAVGCPDGVRLWSPGTANPKLLSGGGTSRALAWSADGRALVSGQEEHSARGWLLPEGIGVALGDYAGPPLSLSFSAPGGFLAPSGNPRVVCWHLDPGGGSPRRSECGAGGAVAITQVACHPTRPLIAAGYENGAALLCQPDSAEILFVRAAGGGAVTTLAWSADGAFLALGAAAGEIGVVAFPERLFRPLPAAHPTEQRKSAP